MKANLKSFLPHIARCINGLAACLALAAAAPAVAAPDAQVGVVLSTSKFASGQDVNVDSETRVIRASKSFKFKLTATCKGESNTPVGKLFPAGTSLAGFIEAVSPGGSKFLSGTVVNPNPNGDLSSPVTLINKKFSGTRNVSGFGSVKISLTVFAQIQTSGKIVFKVTGIKFTTTPQKKLGVVSFMKGSKFEVTAAPMFSLTKATTAAFETNPSVTIPVSRLVNFLGTYTVDYATADGSAHTTSHYSDTHGTLTFNEGDTKKNIVVPLVDNNLSDGTTTFTVTLSNPSTGAFLGSIPVTTVSLKSNE
jgi:hypothetical protein